MVVKMISQKDVLGTSWQLWLVMIGMTIITVFINYVFFRIYKEFTSRKQAFQKILMIIGLVVCSLLTISGWLFIFSLFLSGG
jgi:amino acid transporter